MATIIRCDGCRAELTEHMVTITGQRTDGFGGGDIPVTSGEDFHWCRGCAKAAFAAVKHRAGVPA